MQDEINDLKTVSPSVNCVFTAFKWKTSVDNAIQTFQRNWYTRMHYKLINQKIQSDLFAFLFKCPLWSWTFHWHFSIPTIDQVFSFGSCTSLSSQTSTLVNIKSIWLPYIKHQNGFNFSDLQFWERHIHYKVVTKSDSEMLVWKFVI